MIRFIDVSRGSLLLEGVWSIYLDVFPKCERRPKESLLQMVEDNPSSVFLTAYIEKDADALPENVLAMSFIINLPTLPFAYLLFLGVTDKHQGSGIGTEIMRIIKDRFGQSILVDVEPIDDLTANNSAQRQARWRFYQRNGFSKTNLYLHYDSEVFQVLCCGFEATEELIAELSDAKDHLFTNTGLENAWDTTERA